MNTTETLKTDVAAPVACERCGAEIKDGQGHDHLVPDNEEDSNDSQTVPVHEQTNPEE